MEIKITKGQLDSLIPKVESSIPEEDIQFVKKFKEVTGHYPMYKELETMNKKVGDFMPEHSKANVTTYSYIKNYVNKYFKIILAKIAKEEGISYIQGKRGAARYVSSDYKKILRSEFEILTYNLFVLEGLSDEIEFDSKRFLKTCNKIPDIVWEKRKMVIEIAGMEGEEYHKKLDNAKECFNKLGYDVKILNARKFQKQNRYVDFYLHLCEQLGFEPRPEVIETPYKFLGYKDLDRNIKQKFIDEHINNLPLTSFERYTLNAYINQLYGYGIKEYKKRNELKRFRHSIDKNEIRKFKSENPHLSNREIAKHFGVGRNTVQIATLGMNSKRK